jgi:hypothetical protein
MRAVGPLPANEEYIKGREELLLLCRDIRDRSIVYTHTLYKMNSIAAAANKEEKKRELLCYTIVYIYNIISLYRR